jgi:hypothetical protein
MSTRLSNAGAFGWAVNERVNDAAKQLDLTHSVQLKDLR